STGVRLHSGTVSCLPPHRTTWDGLLLSVDACHESSSSEGWVVRRVVFRRFVPPLANDSCPIQSCSRTTPSKHQQRDTQVSPHLHLSSRNTPKTLSRQNGKRFFEHTETLGVS
ncbi:unnamed protein product, partial [Ectocarpus sp. 4 AP-2014]